MILEVACAIIRKGNQILATQHGDHPTLPWKWEFPGGKLEPDESAEDCILREIREELDLEIRILERFPYVDYLHPERTIRLIPFLCEIVSGTITLHEHHAMRWGAPADLQDLDWGDGDREVLRLVL